MDKHPFRIAVVDLLKHDLVILHHWILPHCECMKRYICLFFFSSATVNIPPNAMHAFRLTTSIHHRMGRSVVGSILRTTQSWKSDYTTPCLCSTQSSGHWSAWCWVYALGLYTMFDIFIFFCSLGLLLCKGRCTKISFVDPSSSQFFPLRSGVTRVKGQPGQLTNNTNVT